LQINFNDTSSPTNQNAAVVGAKQTTTAVSKQRRRKPVPDKLKNETYWLKRQRNNDAARKSRDTKRAKYDELAVRVALLEKENAHLHGDNLRLMGEVDQLRAILRIYTELPAQIW
jgi:predicted nuclease with TOPRIM domain